MTVFIDHSSVYAKSMMITKTNKKNNKQKTTKQQQQQNPAWAALLGELNSNQRKL